MLSHCPILGREISSLRVIRIDGFMIYTQRRYGTITVAPWYGHPQLVPQQQQQQHPRHHHPILPYSNHRPNVVEEQP